MKPTSRPVALLLVVLAWATACGSDPARVPLDELPAYTAEQASLYNDALAPEIFGLKGSASAATSDATLAEIVSQADHVGRVKLTTVTRTKTPGDGRVRYQLVLQSIGDPLQGEPLEPNVQVTVSMGSPSNSLLRALDTEAVGAKFVVCLKRYRARGQMVLHFRAYPDSPEWIAALSSSATH